jgi:hypothetical protein
MNIYNPDGSVLIQDVPITKDAKHYEELMKSNYIKLSWNDNEYKILPTGAYIEWHNVRYKLFEDYRPTIKDEVKCQYEPEFQHPMMILDHTPCMLATYNAQGDTVKEPTWTFTGSLQLIAGRLQTIIAEELGVMLETSITISDKTLAASATVSFDGDTIWSALGKICQAWDNEIEFHVTWDITRGTTEHVSGCIYFGDIAITEKGTAQLTDGVNTVTTSRTANNEDDFANYYIVKGGTRNITTLTASGDNVQTDTRMTLDPVKYPNSAIDKRTSTDQPLLQDILIFDDIYPSLTLYCYNIRQRTRRREDENGDYIVKEYNPDGSVKTYKTYTVYYLRLAYPVKNADGTVKEWKAFSFDKTADKVSGKKLMCSFTANEEGSHSALAGRDFEMTYHTADRTIPASTQIGDTGVQILTGDWEIVFEEEDDLIIPNNDTLQPYGETTPSLKCDTLQLYNILLTGDYLTAAQEKLLAYAEEEIARRSTDKDNYTLKSYPHVFKQNNPNLFVGQKVEYTNREGVLTSHVIKLETSLECEYVQTITIGNAKITGSITSVKDEVKAMSGVIDINTNSITAISSAFARISKQIKSWAENFLSRTEPDTAQGCITFADGLKLADGTTHEIQANGNAKLAAIDADTATLTDKVTLGNNENYSINSQGQATLSSVTLDTFHDPAWNTAKRTLVGAEGFEMYLDELGKSHLWVDTLSVRMKALFASLEIRKISYSGGTTIFSNAGSTIKKVAPAYNAKGEKIGYKCWIAADDGTTATTNYWRTGMMALCKTFNIDSGQYENVANRYYWRLVLLAGYETLSDGKRYDYVILSDIKEFHADNKDAWPAYTMQHALAAENSEDKVLGWNADALSLYEQTTETFDIGEWVLSSGYMNDDDNGIYIGSNEKMMYGYDPSAENDIPQADDVIVQCGDQYWWNSYGNVIVLRTAADDEAASGNTVPAIAMYHAMGAPWQTADGKSNNPYQWKRQTFLASPETVYINSNNFKWLTDDGQTYDPVTSTYRILASSTYLQKDAYGKTKTTSLTLQLVKQTGDKTEYQDISGLSYKLTFTNGYTLSGTFGEGTTIIDLADLLKAAGFTLSDVAAFHAEYQAADKTPVVTFDLAVIQDGANGSSVSIKGSLPSKENLPTSGAAKGDGYLIDGYLWTYTGTTTTDTTHYRGFENVGQIKGDKGADGVSAIAFSTEGSLSYTTGTDGIVTDLTPTVSVYATVDGKDVASQCTVSVSSTEGCTATVSHQGTYFDLSLSAIATESVTKGSGTYIMSQTAGSVTLNVRYNGNDYPITVPFSVSVTKLVASIRADAESISMKVDNVADNLAATGIDITNRKIEMTADKFTLKNNSGTKNLYADSSGNLTVRGTVYADNGTFNGTVNATSGKFSGEINATSGTFNNGTMTNATVKQGTIDSVTATNFDLNSGTIACFTFDGAQIRTTVKKDKEGEIIPEGSLTLTSTQLSLVDKNKTRQAFFGPASFMGYPYLAWLQDTTGGTDHKIGLYVDMQGDSLYAANDALQIAGGCISGLRLRTEILSKSGTTIGSLTNVATIDTAGTYYLPNLGQKPHMDGQIITLKKQCNGTVTIKASGSNYISWGNTDGTSTGQSYDQLGNINMAVTFVFFAKYQHASQGWKGAWVEFKHTPNW